MARTSTDPGVWRRSTLGRAWIAIMMVVGELAEMVVSGIPMNWALDSSSSAVDIVPMFALFAGLSTGIPVMVLVSITNFTAARDRRTRGQISPRAHQYATGAQWAAIARIPVVLLLAGVGANQHSQDTVGASLLGASILAMAFYLAVDLIWTSGLTFATTISLRRRAALDHQGPYPGPVPGITHAR